MKKILLALLLPIAALAQTAVQKVGGGNNTISNGSIVIGNNTTITTTGNGSISGNIVPTSVPWSVLTSIPSPTLSVTGDGTAAFTLLAGGGATGAFTLATVNSNVGTFAGITVNGKGLVTAAANLTITTTAPLTGGGTLGNLTIAMPAATTSVNGYLTSTDWTTFNSKQAAGNYITALTGDGTAAGPGSSVFTLATVATGATTGSSTAIPVVTFNNKGLVTGITTAAVVAPAGTLTGTTLASNVVSSSLTSVGTITAGTWNGTVLAGQYGGSGVANTGTTFTRAGNVTFAGAFAFIGRVTAATDVTFPTSGTLATTAGTVASITGTAGQILANGLTTAQTGAVTLTLPSTITQATTFSAQTLFTGSTSAAAGAIGVTSSDPSLRLKATGTVVADQNTYEIRNIGSTGNTYLQFRTVNDANSVFTTRMALWNSGGIYLGNGGSFADPGAGNIWIEGGLRGSSVLSPSSTNLTIGTTTFGTSITLTSATGAVAVATAATFNSSILGSGVVTLSSATASTNTSTGALVLSGSNAGIGLSGSIFAGATITSTYSGRAIAATTTTGYFYTSARYNSASNGQMLFNNGSNTNFVLAETAPDVYSIGQGSEAGAVTSTASFNVSTKAVTLAGILTVSGTGTSSFAGPISTTSNAGNTISSIANNGNGLASLTLTTGAGSTPQTWLVGSNASSSAQEFFIRDSTNSTNVMTASKGTASSTVVTFPGTLSGTSTTAAAVLAKSLGLTENLITGGFTGHTGAVTLGSGGFSTSSWNASIYQDPTAGAVLTGTAQYGLLSQTRFTSGSTVSGTAVYAQVFTAAASYTQTSSYDFYAANPSKGAASAITTAYGLYVEGMTSGGTNYSIYTNAGLVRFGDNVSTTGSITTGTPAGGAGAAAVKFGVVRTGVALAASTTTGLQIDYAGTLYTLAVLSTNP